ncbi:hypothetical protein QJ854_gp710 [Moumouvirus goulette]|uniref:Repeat protein n=1 Tax=Moumouvirus goulette TaxID=1247379 RepID=M1PWE3_9VIRU|nr:hypothetical protein QJ854_gp710 [Moumouvirus goulette]AGF85072.1 hypothetical protein glt_00263 [Moumouvirus goulette]
MNNRNIVNISKIRAKYLVFYPTWIPGFPNWIPGYPNKFPIWFPTPSRYPHHIYYVSETNKIYISSNKINNTQ